LRKWDKIDPIDKEEIQKNNTIHRVQGVRNPFIDYSGLANKIDNF